MQSGRQYLLLPPLLAGLGPHDPGAGLQESVDGHVPWPGSQSLGRGLDHDDCDAVL